MLAALSISITRLVRRLASGGWFVLAAAGVLNAAGQPISKLEVDAAVEKGLRVVEKSLAVYPEHRTCFSCHHQTLPMQAMVVARQHGFEIDEKLFQQQVELTRAFFQSRADDLREGGTIGGKSMTVGFGLWALDLASAKSDKTTASMIEYLLRTQEGDGRFWSSATRPPLEDSAFTGTTVAAYYMHKLSDEARASEVKRGAQAALQWLIQAEPVSQEDRNSKLWGLHLLGAGRDAVDRARDAVLKPQRSDGGWAQLAGMESDAYATGQTLFVLHETGFVIDEPAYQRGARFLLSKQLADGSWHVRTRSKPVQTYFESGFPHGKDQFISICATSWAVAALAKTRTASD